MSERRIEFELHGCSVRPGQSVYIRPNAHWRNGCVGELVSRREADVVVRHPSGFFLTVPVDAARIEPDAQMVATAELKVAGLHRFNERDVHIWMLARQHASRSPKELNGLDVAGHDFAFAAMGRRVEVGQTLYVLPSYHSLYRDPQGVVEGLFRGDVTLCHSDGTRSVIPIARLSFRPYPQHHARGEMAQSGLIRSTVRDVAIWMQAKCFSDRDAAIARGDGIPYCAFLNL